MCGDAPAHRSSCSRPRFSRAGNNTPHAVDISLFCQQTVMTCATSAGLSHLAPAAPHASCCRRHAPPGTLPTASFVCTNKRRSPSVWGRLDPRLPAAWKRVLCNVGQIDCCLQRRSTAPSLISVPVSRRTHPPGIHQQIDLTSSLPVGTSPLLYSTTRMLRRLLNCALLLNMQSCNWGETSLDRPGNPPSRLVCISRPHAAPSGRHGLPRGSSTNGHVQDSAARDSLPSLVVSLQHDLQDGSGPKDTAPQGPRHGPTHPLSHRINTDLV